MLGVKFGDLHSYDDLELILQTVEMPLPTPKTSTVEVMGADGVIDLTSYFGDVRFNNRTITMTFTDADEYGQRYINQSRVADNLHGQQVRIVFDEDPDYYYSGRLSVESFSVTGSTRTIKITADCDPYKYLINEGSEPWKWNPFSFEDGIIRSYSDLTVNGETRLTVVGGWKSVHPTISTDKPLQVKIDDGQYYSIPAGVTKVYNITIGRGEHVLTFNGTNAKVDIRIQVGSF